MNKKYVLSINLFIIALIAAGVCIFAGTDSFAASVPNAKGAVNSENGAYLRKSASIKSAKKALLKDGTRLTIYKEVFKSKKKRSAKNRWYYVKADGQKGYIRADLVCDITYGSRDAKAKAKIKYYKGAGTKMKKAGTLKKGKKFSVCLKAKPVFSTRGGSSVWYKVKIGSNYYYMCSKKVKLLSEASEAASSYTSYTGSAFASMTDAEFEQYLKNQGFPSAYIKKLKTLHKSHPNWGFVAYDTGIKWSDALAKQTKGGVSLVSASYPKSYRSGSKQYEKGWYKAAAKVVSYYMDPRNFLTENGVYMFEDLSYKPEYQTVNVVKAILAPTKLPKNGFTAKLFIKAAAKYNVSPVFLAARARQETGGGSVAITGKSSLGKVYNPFNIGAFGGTDPLYNGLLYAKAKGWTTRQKAVYGGAEQLSKYYISQGQFTGYYQRFNVRNGLSKAGTHQYMTNITAAYTESLSTGTSYKKYGITNQPLVFEIPIYKSMPSATKLP